MNLEQEQERIQQYLNNTLTSDERSVLESDAASNPQLAELLLHFRKLRLMGNHNALVEGKALLDQIMEATPVTPDYGAHEHYFAKPFWQKGIVRWIIGAALFIVAVTWGTWYAQRQQQEQELIILSKQQTQPLENLIGFAPDDRSNAALGMAAYDRRNYSAAIPLLNVAVAESPDDNSLKLYLAVSHLMLGEAAMARDWLDQLAIQDGFTTIPAKWYLALALMQQQEPLRARVLLESIASDTIYGDSAKKILDGLPK